MGDLNIAAAIIELQELEEAAAEIQKETIPPCLDKIVRWACLQLEHCRARIADGQLVEFHFHEVRSSIRYLRSQLLK